MNTSTQNSKRIFNVFEIDAKDSRKNEKKRKRKEEAMHSN
jgi:hypothetical protein